MPRITKQDIQKAADIIRRGGVIALPTETVYGLACDPRNVKAVKQIFCIKGRADDKPLQLIASSFAQVTRLADMTTAEKRLARVYWPGPLTMLVRLRSGMRLAKQVSPSSVIGIRVSPSPVVRALIRAFGYPIAATSANRSGLTPVRSGNGVKKAFQGFIDQPDMILDVGMLPRRKPSTVVRVKESGDVEVLRQGGVRIDKRLIKR